MEEIEDINKTIQESLYEVNNPSENIPKSRNGIGVKPLSRPVQIQQLKKSKSTSFDFHDQAQKDMFKQINENKREVMEEAMKNKYVDNGSTYDVIEIPPEMYIPNKRNITPNTLKEKNNRLLNSFAKTLGFFRSEDNNLSKGVDRLFNAEKNADDLLKMDMTNDASTTLEELKEQQVEDVIEDSLPVVAPKKDNADFSVPEFVDQMGIFEGTQGGDNVLNIDTLPYGITVKSAKLYKMDRSSPQYKDLSDREFANIFYEKTNDALLKRFNKVDFNQFNSSQRMSILSTFANTNFNEMPSYIRALRNEDVDEMAVQLLDTISVKRNNRNFTVNGLALRGASEYNLLMPDNQIEFVQVKSQKGNYNRPVIYNYLDKDNNIINTFAPKSRTLDATSKPKDGKTIQLYSVSQRKEII